MEAQGYGASPRPPEKTWGLPSMQGKSDCNRSPGPGSGPCPLSKMGLPTACVLFQHFFKKGGSNRSLGLRH